MSINKESLIIKVDALIKSNQMGEDQKVHFLDLLRVLNENQLRKYLIIKELMHPERRQYLDIAEDYGCSLETVKQYASQKRALFGG